MNDAKEELGRKLVHFFEDLGLDPLYSITVLVIIVTLSYYKDFQRKEELPFWHRGIMYSTFFGAIVLVFFSLLQIFGAF